MKKLKREMIEYKSSKLLGDLNMEKEIKIEEIKEIEIKLEELKIPKTIVSTIKKSIIPEKHLCHILRYKKYCA